MSVAKSTALRAEQFGVAEHFTDEEWATLCERYGNKCLGCGKVGNLQVDHVVALARGGANTISNIQPLCLECNKRKKDNHVDYRVTPPFRGDGAESVAALRISRIREARIAHIGIRTYPTIKASAEAEAKAKRLTLTEWLEGLILQEVKRTTKAKQ